jgi:hypothetical protein
MLTRFMLPFVLLVAVRANAVVLTDNEKSDYVIVLGANASAVDKTAAGELRDGLKRVTSVDIPIKSESDVDAKTKQILIGSSNRAKQLLLDVKWDAFGKDAILVRTVGGNLILAGHPQRGSLYAVHTFLEDVVGVRWWTSSESFYATKPRLDVGELNIAYEPPIKYREAYYFDTTGDHFEFATRLKLDGQHNTGISPAWGGHYSIIGWCHTFYHLLPPEKYFAQHPEWYSLINGKRTTENAQLCLSNEDMRRELVRRALKQIEKNPSAGIISISQNDCFNACQCDQRRATVKEEGSESGPLIRFVNAVAQDIVKQYPDFLVETLAYQWSRHPPKKTHPAKNVLVRLCSIEADFARPLEGETNKPFGDDLRGWAAMAPNLFVWNYVTDFACYHQPHPNLRPLGADLRFFANNKVIGVFEQGDYYNQGAGDFLPLRAWLVAHLLWNPNADQGKLREEFLSGYYGAASKPLSEYLDLIADKAQQSGIAVTCYNGNLSFITPQTLEKSRQLFDQAERAVANDAEKLARVRRERLPIDLLAIQRFDVARHVKAALAKNPDADANEACAEYHAMLDRWSQAAREYGTKHWSEGEAFDAGVNKLAARCRNAFARRASASTRAAQ